MNNSGLFILTHQQYVTLLPKSITTAIGMGVSEELVDDTTNNHVPNVDFYINEFLLYMEMCEAKNGYDSIEMFWEISLLEKNVG